MRLCAPPAAFVLLTLLVAAGSCKPSSLTPFTGTREPETETTGLNGSWEGQANAPGAAPGIIRFTVISGDLADFTVFHNTPACLDESFGGSDLSESIEDDAFEVDLALTPQGRFVLRGRFTSSSECSGSYFFDGLSSTGDCPTSGSGSFVATKTQ